MSWQPKFVIYFSNTAEKTRPCFALDTEHQYWTVTVQYMCRVKKISMTSNVLLLQFATQVKNSLKKDVLHYCNYLGFMNVLFLVTRQIP